MKGMIYLKTEKRGLSFKIVDIVYLILAILPIVAAIALNIFTKGPSDGISVSGARIFFTIPMPVQDLPITEAQVNSWLVMLTIFWLCLYMTHGLTEVPSSKRQHFAELIVEKTQGLVDSNMGSFFKKFAPFICAIMALSAFSSLLSLFGLFAPTSDINVVGGWAICTFALITYYRAKNGPLEYIKSFGKPVPLLSPMNVISEVATPVSLAFRHYGNVIAGSVISILVGSALQGLSKSVLGWLPGKLADIPFLQIGIPAVLSVYFDVFSSLLQAFIFAMLTMLYVSGAFDEDTYVTRQAKKNKKLTENINLEEN